MTAAILNFKIINYIKISDFMGNNNLNDKTLNMSKVVYLQKGVLKGYLLKV